MLYKPSTLPCDKIFVVCEFNKNLASGYLPSGLHKLYGKLARVVYEMIILDRRFVKYIARQLRAVLESGADLNLMLLDRNENGLWSNFHPKRMVKLTCYDLFCDFQKRGNESNMFIDSSREWIRLHKILKFLFENGLSFFYYTIYHPRRDLYPDVDNLISESLLNPLEWSEFALPLLPLARGIALQLLALGYGRRELNTGSYPVRDANLSATRELVAFYINENEMEARRELQSLIDQFDAGPLTLQQLARIALRRAVGGVDFARRVRRIKSIIPPPLFDYVAEPSEYLLTDDEVHILEASNH